ncbi:MAG TPA: class I SAM-dependent methyltransferase [Candidatus Binatia bacterium]
MPTKISGLSVGLAILVSILGLGWPENRRAVLHADDNDWESPHIAPFAPTPPEVVSRMLELAEIKHGDVLYDLGSGDGRIVVAAAKRFGIRAVGFEIDPVLVKDSRQIIKRAGLEELVEIREQDIRAVDFSPASVVTMYLYPAANLRLRPVLMRDLRPGSRVISHDFNMGSWKPDRVERLQDRAGIPRTIYRWRIAEPAGS